MSIKHTEEIESQTLDTGEGVSRQILISPDEGPNFAMRKFRIAPGGYMPEHTNKVEHEQYVLNGRATINLGGRTFDVQAGDIVFIPAGVPHWYRTEGDEPFEFLCMVPNQADETTIIRDCRPA